LHCWGEQPPISNRVGTFTSRSGHGVGYDLTLI